MLRGGVPVLWVGGTRAGCVALQVWAFVRAGVDEVYRRGGCGVFVENDKGRPLKLVVFQRSPFGLY